jgi:hypothetical protein
VAKRRERYQCVLQVDAIVRLRRAPRLGRVGDVAVEIAVRRSGWLSEVREHHERVGQVDGALAGSVEEIGGEGRPIATDVRHGPDLVPIEALVGVGVVVARVRAGLELIGRGEAVDIGVAEWIRSVTWVGRSVGARRHVEREKHGDGGQPDAGGSDKHACPD